MKLKPLILVTNDDGVHAKGIYHLWNSLRGVGDLIVVSPEKEQSSVSLSITVRHPLHLEQINWVNSEANVWSVSGTPADCVKLALNAILPRKPDLIVSGINRGSNAGRNVLYSGTVAAIIEGVMQGIPGIAFSFGDYFNPSFQLVESFIPGIVNYALQNRIQEGTFLNVNFPKSELGPIKGIRLTSQGKEYWAENPEKRHHPAEQQVYYWLGSKLAEYEEKEDCDISLLKQGYTTVVPLHIGDLTNHQLLQKEKETFEKLVN
jgi:5'-nucleotidase